MKLTLLKITLIFLGIYFLVKFSPPLPISSVVTQKTDLFTVSGEGKVTAVPDTAIVTLGITVNKPTVKAAQSEVNTVIKNITSSLKSLQIADADIKTTDYSVYPQYNYAAGANKITGYSVSASLTVTVKNIDNVNQVIDSATAAGANNVSGIQFTVDEARQKDLLNQARELAVKEAKDKAASLSSAAGLSLGRIVNVQESQPNQIRPIMFNAKVADQATGGAAPSTEVQPGSTDITSSVTLSYETR